VSDVRCEVCGARGQAEGGQALTVYFDKTGKDVHPRCAEHPFHGVDWRALFKRYVQVVEDQESVNFLEERDGYNGAPWSPDEWAAIEALLDEVRAEEAARAAAVAIPIPERPSVDPEGEGETLEQVKEKWRRALGGSEITISGTYAPEPTLPAGLRQCSCGKPTTWIQVDVRDTQATLVPLCDEHGGRPVAQRA